MTIPVAVPNYYTGNASTADYDYDFLIRVDTDILATVRNPDTDAETTLVLTTDYTVSGEGESAGGQISLVDSGQAWLDDNGYLDTGWILSIRRVRPLTQTTDIRNQGDFYPETHEDQFDNCLMVDQQQQDELDKALKLPETVDVDDVSTALPVPEASKIIGWNSAGTALENYSPNTSAYLTKATQSEAQAGTEDTAYMTPSKTKDAIDALTQDAVEDYETAVNLTISTGAVATDGSLGKTFNISATSDFTLSNPTNAHDGQTFVWRVKQDGTGSRLITLDTKFTVCSEVSSVVLSTAASAIDYIGAKYNETDDKFEVIAFASEQA